MLIRVAIAAVLLGHAAIHLGFLAPRPVTVGGPRWPFHVERSWLVGRLRASGMAMRPLAGLLVMALFTAYAVGALAIVVDEPAVDGPAIAIGSAVSLAVLGLFPDRWLLLGVVIDLVLLWGVLVGGASSWSFLR
jgi:hypothetical protein